MKKTMWLVVVLVIGGIAAGLFYWQWSDKELQPAEILPAIPAPAPEPRIKYPIESAPLSNVPLPELEKSDETLLGTITGFVGKKAVEDFFEIKELARRVVVTVDHLPRQKLPLRYRLIKPVSGKFPVTGQGDNYLVHPENVARYKPYVLLAQGVDIKNLVAVYKRFYPLFQEEYVNLGHPQGYFNDRLVEAIDDLLAAPEFPGPITVTRPKVLYVFADPALEDLSAGQKIMIRMGPDNARRVKARLREFRHELTGQVPAAIEPNQKN